jgi:hypothetical protein
MLAMAPLNPPDRVLPKMAHGMIASLACPAAQDVEGWSKLMRNRRGAGNASFGTKIGKCSCHWADGRASVAPTCRNKPRAASGARDSNGYCGPSCNRDMAPQFTPWQIVTKDGKQHIGLPRRKGGNSEAYLGTDGREFSLKNTDIESRHEATVSIMPSDLLQQLTRQELADLFAFLTAAR